MKLTIIGCGYTGRRLALLARERGYPVAAGGRTDFPEDLVRQGVETIRVDLDRPATLDVLPLAGRMVVYLAPPPAAGQVDPRMERFCAAARRNPPCKVVYVSTTGVYGDCAGALVKEDRPPHPQTDRSRRRLAAETALRKWGRETGTATVVLRVAGIYGPGRLPLAALRSGRAMPRPADAPFSNRIHVDDLAAVCLAAAERAAGGTLYNVSDGQHGTMTDYFLAVADAFELPRPPLIAMADAERLLSPAMVSYLRESRRIDNRRLLEELNVELAYPTLEAGLRACQETSSPPIAGPW